MGKKQQKRVKISFGIDPITDMIINRIAANKFVQPSVIYREALDAYAQENNPYEKLQQEVTIRDLSERGREATREAEV